MTVANILVRSQECNSKRPASVPENRELEGGSLSLMYVSNAWTVECKLLYFTRLRIHKIALSSIVGVVMIERLRDSNDETLAMSGSKVFSICPRDMSPSEI